MSYDIQFLPVPHGRTLAEVVAEYEETERDEVDGTVDLAVWDQLVAGFRGIVGPDVEDGVDPDSGEVSETNTGLTVFLAPSEATVSFPYWEHDDEAAFARQVDEVVAMVERLTGWQAYDPQADAPYRGIDQQAMDRVADLKRSLTEDSGSARPRLTRDDLLPPSRQRFLTYLISGLVCLVGGAYLLAQEPLKAGDFVVLGLGLLNTRVAVGIRRRMRTS